jgi:hypothetical protein
LQSAPHSDNPVSRDLALETPAIIMGNVLESCVRARKSNNLDEVALRQTHIHNIVFLQSGATTMQGVYPPNAPWNLIDIVLRHPLRTFRYYAESRTMTRSGIHVNFTIIPKSGARAMTFVNAGTQLYTLLYLVISHNGWATNRRIRFDGFYGTR